MKHTLFTVQIVISHFWLVCTSVLMLSLPGCFSSQKRELAHATEALTQEWHEFIKENEAHHKYAIQHHLPVYSGIVKVTTSSSYDTLFALQKNLYGLNKKCAQFYEHPQLHMSLLYFNIPIEHNKPFDEAKLVAELTHDLTTILSEFAPVLESVEFEYVGTKILGKNNNFIVASFEPHKGVTYIQDYFILPFGTLLFKKHKHAWFGFVEDPTFHISLAKIKPHCTARSITIPHDLPAVHTYPLKSGTLKVSLHGPTKKPYHQNVPGWLRKNVRKLY